MLMLIKERRLSDSLESISKVSRYELIREVRARSHSFQNLPAIALTALASPPDRRRALLAGYQVHVSKPIDSRELTAAIAALIGRTEHH